MSNPSSLGSKYPAILVQNLRKRFGAHIALDGVGFELKRGERLGLLGPNGAGKTTLVRCLSGRIRSDSGEIKLEGQSVLAEAVSSALLGIVPQELAIYQDLTAYQNLFYFGRFHGLRGGDLKSRVAWALEWTGLKDRRSQLVRHFSGGMKRRINLACGVLHQPRVLLLDEPTVGVDPQSRERIYAMIDSLSDEGCSILLTTHHMDEAESQCDRLVIMDRGRIVADGSIDALIEKTIGSTRWVRLRFRMTQDAIDFEKLIYEFSTHIEEYIDFKEESVVKVRMNEVARNLPLLIGRLEGNGIAIEDIEVHAPSLHDVFIELTGEQLRDD
jgi:ABC-2 type transport system ATP-binding protein